MINTISNHFLQSDDWAKFQEQRGVSAVHDSGDGWEYYAFIERANGLTRLYCPYGPSLASSASFEGALKSLRAAAQKHGADYIRIQPPASIISRENITSYGLRSSQDIQPAHTWCIDLTQPLDTLFADMKQNTRNVCRNYRKKGMQYRSSTDPRDIDHLVSLLGGVAQRNDITVHGRDYFRQQAEALFSQEAAKLHFITHQDTIIAAAMTYQHDGTWYYAHAAADYEHRKLAASTALVGEIIQHAKAAGAHTFDMYGITTSSDKNHKWAGFTKFKQSFGGYAVDLGATYELPINRLMYAMYRFARRVTGR